MIPRFFSNFIQSQAPCLVTEIWVCVNYRETATFREEVSVLFSFP